MAKWGEYTHEAVLVAAENLVNLSTELRDRLSGQAKELSHDDAEFFLRKIIGMAEFMSGTVAGEKSAEAAFGLSQAYENGLEARYSA